MFKASNQKFLFPIQSECLLPNSPPMHLLRAVQGRNTYLPLSAIETALDVTSSSGRVTDKHTVSDTPSYRHTNTHTSRLPSRGLHLRVALSFYRHLEWRKQTLCRVVGDLFVNTNGELRPMSPPLSKINWNCCLNFKYTDDASKMEYSILVGTILEVKISCRNV